MLSGKNLGILSEENKERICVLWKSELCGAHRNYINPRVLSTVDSKKCIWKSEL